MLVEEDNSPVAIVREVLFKRGCIDLPSQGNSMYPLIKEGDICRFSSCDPSELKKRDIILFSTPSNNLVAHRLIHIEDSCYLFKGDANLQFDPAINQSYILGKLIYIKRNDRKLYLDTFPLIVWGHFIQAVPVVSSFIRLYLKYNTSA
jgi:signal peptidase